MKIRRITQRRLRTSVPPLCLLLITASRHRKWASASNTHRSRNLVRPGCYYCCLVDIKEKKVNLRELHKAPQLHVQGLTSRCTWTIQIQEYSLKTTATFKDPPSTGSLRLDSLLL